MEYPKRGSSPDAPKTACYATAAGALTPCTPRERAGDVIPVWCLAALPGRLIARTTSARMVAEALIQIGPVSGRPVKNRTQRMARA
jgi:hypothetical protein